MIILKKGNKKEIAQRLIFAETIFDNLVKSYKERPNDYDHCTVKKILKKNVKLLRKYSLIGISSNIFLKLRLLKLSLDKQANPRGKDSCT